MKRELKVIEFNKKQKLLDLVNQEADKIDIVSISTCRESTYYSHFLWYYDK